MITIIIGPARSGKSMLATAMQEHLEKYCHTVKIFDPVNNKQVNAIAEAVRDYQEAIFIINNPKLTPTDLDLKELFQILPVKVDKLINIALYN